ncbi:hypothetical protein LOK49_LG11G01369 [Camellia lanceoleosa]|uniref:Uncharacterized protein n=1 Tax=Camellia lanceoleosa TaxID=1840588 RepID=A0ACC0FZP8_9ERIC|nr:hypothetical protein LOK49_LG11G01369 [Camellia lanceoleosa]
MSKKANNHKNKSLCEKSMQMVVNFIKLSSISLASLSLGTTSVGHTLPDQNRSGRKGIVPPKNVLKVSQIQGSQTQKSQEPESDSMSYSYLMDPSENKGSSDMVSEVNDSTDNRFSDYIQRFHDKNRRDSITASKGLPYILPPPPPRRAN